jgi:hypothetical protein
MFQYFIQPLNIYKIKPSIIHKLKEKFDHSEQNEHILYTKNGYYIINNDSIHLFKIINKDNSKQENFLNKYTLFGNQLYIKKIENITNLPVHYTSVNIKKIYFFTKESNNKMVFEINQDKIINLYFISKDRNLYENNYFFNNDISLYLKSLNI